MRCFCAGPFACLPVVLLFDEVGCDVSEERRWAIGAEPAGFGWIVGEPDAQTPASVSVRGVGGAVDEHDRLFWQPAREDYFDEPLVDAGRFDLGLDREPAAELAAGRDERSVRAVQLQQLEEPDAVRGFREPGRVPPGRFAH